MSDRLAAGAASASSARPIDAAALSKLRWRCRRGLLENDLLLEKFFARAQPVTQADANALYSLMELADNDLLDLFLGRQKPTARLDRPEVRDVIEAVRARADGSARDGARHASPAPLFRGCPP